MSFFSFKALGWASFRDGLLFEITFSNSWGELLFKVNPANTARQWARLPTTQIVQPRNMPKCQIILNKNTNLIMYCLEKKHMGFFSRLLLQTQDGRFFSRWVCSRDEGHWSFFRRFTVWYCRWSNRSKLMLVSRTKIVCRLASSSPSQLWSWTSLCTKVFVCIHATEVFPSVTTVEERVKLSLKWTYCLSRLRLLRRRANV